MDFETALATIQPHLVDGTLTVKLTKNAENRVVLDFQDPRFPAFTFFGSSSAPTGPFTQAVGVSGFDAHKPMGGRT